MTTIKLSSGDLGSETLRVRCDLSQASASVQVDYDTGNGWEPTQYQCADARHTNDGLAEIGKTLAAQAVEMPRDGFDCEWAVAEDLFTVRDSNSNDSGLTYAEAVERIGEWYEDADEWNDGDSDPELHAAIRDAIDSVETPADGGNLSALTQYANEIREAVAEAMGARSFAGHGRYEVSAADRIGCDLSVSLDD